MKREKQQTLTDQRHQYQQKDEQLREQLEAKRLAWQAAKSDREHYQEQLKELNAELQKGLQIDLAEHQQKLEKVQKQFEKIGAVNLAASQEFEEVSQRFDELSHQTVVVNGVRLNLTTISCCTTRHVKSP